MTGEEKDVPLTTNPSINDDFSPAVARVSLKAPPYWSQNPKLYFAQIESQFAIAGITKDETKYHHVVAAIETDVIAHISDIILNPPEELKYEALKECLIEQFADSETRRLKLLLQELQLGGRSSDSTPKLLQRRQTRSWKLLIHHPSTWSKARLADERTATPFDGKSKSSLNQSKISKTPEQSGEDNPEVQLVEDFREAIRLHEDSTPVLEFVGFIINLEARPDIANTLQLQSGKLERPSLEATSVYGQSKRMFLADKSTGFRFLIDTGAEISVIPPRTIQERNCTASKLKLFAANGTTISTFGEKLITLDLNLRRVFRWPVIIASVSHPIIGADFLKTFGLLVDMKNNCLIDTSTGRKISVQMMVSSEGKITLLAEDSPYKDL
ncbi:hypothetical protein AVEN_208148-1 [Araneus ventricosus]|uniref:Peptidase A2 domain-containing protein n=1 Tax=Araneus ventricosus TaxID=182803 RepID=A0A4Y2N1W9_ARAVE|nr:hypothetical protein AVEN_208148-1 [Araneus ventricosus]